MNKRYQVFVSSTFADLKEERAKVQQTIMESDCIPAGMEVFPAIDEEQFEFIKKVIDDCDYYLLIVGGRYGTLSEAGISYTEMEYDYAIAKGIKVIAFIHSKPEDIPYGKSEQDAKLRKKLDVFRTRISTNRLVKFWSRADELPGLVALSLAKTIKTYPAVGWVRADTLADPDVYRQMNDLRKDNQELRDSLTKALASVPKAVVEDIAGLDEEVRVFGIHSKWSQQHRMTYENKWAKNLTWEKLFALLAPYLIDHPNDEVAKKLIGKVVYNQLPDALEGGEPNVDDQLFQTIKIQFKALGLIEVKRTATTGGGVGVFWYLTKLGEQQMTQLRVIRKQAD